MVSSSKDPRHKDTVPPPSTARVTLALAAKGQKERTSKGSGVVPFSTCSDTPTPTVGGWVMYHPCVCHVVCGNLGTAHFGTVTWSIFMIVLILLKILQQRSSTVQTPLVENLQQLYKEPGLIEIPQEGEAN